MKLSRGNRVYTQETRTLYMKKLFAIMVGIAVVALIQSCSGGQKQCAAYTKHDTGNQPTYHEVQ